jgi:hypothetical protein
MPKITLRQTIGDLNEENQSLKREINNSQGTINGLFDYSTYLYNSHAQLADEVSNLSSQIKTLQENIEYVRFLYEKELKEKSYLKNKASMEFPFEKIEEIKCNAWAAIEMDDFYSSESSEKFDFKKLKVDSIRKIYKKLIKKLENPDYLDVGTQDSIDSSYIKVIKKDFEHEEDFERNLEFLFESAKNLYQNQWKSIVQETHLNSIGIESILYSEENSATLYTDADSNFIDTLKAKIQTYILSAIKDGFERVIVEKLEGENKSLKRKINDLEECIPREKIKINSIYENDLQK